MQDLRDYLRAYLAYIRGCGFTRVLGFVLLWTAGMIAPAGARSLVQFLDWLAFSWKWNVETAARRGGQVCFA
jgi:hypothetical protein